MVHRDGDLHRTVHMWVVRRRKDGGVDVLLQRRSKDKDAYPDCYDISSAGHVLAGDDYESSALRELEEELGIRADREDLRLIGFHEGYASASFWGQPYRNREISAVYLYEKPIKESSLVLQESEVEEAVFMDYDEILAGIRDGSLKNCIYPGEFELIKKALEPGYTAKGVRIREAYE